MILVPNTHISLQNKVTLFSSLTVALMMMMLQECAPPPCCSLHLLWCAESWGQRPGWISVSALHHPSSLQHIRSHTVYRVEILACNIAYCVTDKHRDTHHRTLWYRWKLYHSTSKTLYWMAEPVACNITFCVTSEDCSTQLQGVGSAQWQHSLSKAVVNTFRLGYLYISNRDACSVARLLVNK